MTNKSINNLTCGQHVQVWMPTITSPRLLHLQPCAGSACPSTPRVPCRCFATRLRTQCTAPCCCRACPPDGRCDVVCVPSRPAVRVTTENGGGKPNTVLPVAGCAIRCVRPGDPEVPPGEQDLDHWYVLLCDLSRYRTLTRGRKKSGAREEKPPFELTVGLWGLLVPCRGDRVCPVAVASSCQRSGL
jgi:hypothetical protein